METGRDKACLACHNLKKSCVTGRAEEETEAGPLKKRKVEEKGKGKAKVRTLVPGVMESIAVDVLRDILKELKRLRVEVCDLCAFSQCTTTMSESSCRTLKQTNAHIGELLDHFMAVKNDREGSRDGAENRKTRDVEMEENGVDMIPQF